MTLALAAIFRLGPVFAAAAKKKPASSSSSTLLILVAIAAGFYFLVLRPQQQKAKRQRQQVTTWEVGDEVLTAGGLIGHIIAIEGDRVTLETSMGASFVVHRQYVIRKMEPEPGSLDVQGGLDDEHDVDDEGYHDEPYQDDDPVDPDEDGADVGGKIDGNGEDEDDEDGGHRPTGSN